MNPLCANAYFRQLAMFMSMIEQQPELAEALSEQMALVKVELKRQEKLKSLKVGSCRNPHFRCNSSRGLGNIVIKLKITLTRKNSPCTNTSFYTRAYNILICCCPLFDKGETTHINGY